jgi:hypothetical protein
MTLRRHEVPEVIGLIKQYEPKAFYSVEEVRFAIDEDVPPPAPKQKRKYLPRLGFFIKEK